MHPLLKDLASSDHKSVPPINLVSRPLMSAYDVTQDESISTILQDLTKHITSLKGNLEEMKDMRIWISRAEESLKEILTRTGSSSDLNHVNEAELL